MKVTRFAPHRKSPLYRSAAQRGNHNPARLTTTDCNQPETAATTGKKTAWPAMTMLAIPRNRQQQN